MLTVTKSFSWSMAHRLGKGYTGKCQHLHGHTYRAEITCGGPINEIGMVVDFDQIKKHVQYWIMDRLDHAIVIAPHDKELREWAQHESQKHYLLPSSCDNSTAECLAILLSSVTVALPVTKVRVYETDDSWAEWTA